jgi:undecaprenyl-diphosphatase
MIIFTRPSVILALLGLFILAAMAGGPTNGFERKIMQAIAEFRAGRPNLTGMVVGITNLGGAYATLGVTAVASLWMLLRRSPAPALLLAVCVLIERVLMDGLKEWIGRPRPNFGVDWLPQSLAYPSGHSANSMTAFLATALIVTPPAHRGPLAAGAITLSIVVGLSRIYLGVHWPSDVIGGWTVGLVAVGATLIIGERSGALRLEPQHEVVGRHGPPLSEDEAA